MTEHEIKIAFKEYDSIEELTAADKALCTEAVKALATSHSPYSKFRVGVALQLQSGKILHGSNQENVAYPSGLCAERVALFNVGSNYPNEIIKTMAITAQTENFKIENPVTSCGACLQTMSEYEKKQNSLIEILFYCIDGKVLKVKGVNCLLPFAFVEDRLGG